MKCRYSIYFLLFISVMNMQCRTYSEREDDLLSDSVLVNSVLESVRSDIVRDEIQRALVRISGSKKIFREFRVDVYERSRHDYRLKSGMNITISDLLDSLYAVIKTSRILRINTVDMNNVDGKAQRLTGNSFKDLEKEPVYRDKEFILGLIEKTALGSHQKSSLEWIWGKSPDSDAYFSTKLTFYDDLFSLYPEYRFYVGYDPLRDKNSWFFTLKDHPEEQETLYADRAEIIINDDNLSLDDSIVYREESAEPAEQFDCGSEGIAELDFETDIVLYTKQADGEFSSVSSIMGINGLLRSAFKSGVRFIRFNSTDFSFTGGEMKRSESESVVEISGDITVCSVRIKSFLAEGMSGMNRRRSVELITGINRDKMSYNAGVITVYDGQTSYFSEYRIYASSELRRDKNSWFNRF